jgi:hypothetical protein
MQEKMLKLASQFVMAFVIATVLLAVHSQAQTEQIIYTFTGGTNGSSPQRGPVRDAKGNLYGVLESGGANGAGLVFELSRSSGGTWGYTVLYSFSFVGGDVAWPTSNLVFDRKGNLYGAAFVGGENGVGGIFELSRGSNGEWSEKVVYSFAGGADIAPTGSGLIIDSEGSLYGYRGIAYLSNGTMLYGAVIKIQADPNGVWSEQVLHTFSGGNDGSAPYGGQLTFDASGNLYGMANDGLRDYGLVFELVHGTDGSWTEKVLHAFTGGAEGSALSTPLAVDSRGNVYGASTWAIFDLEPGADGTWSKKILHTFAGGSDGAYPDSGISLAPSGNLYGTTNQGGAHVGTVFELSPESNGNWSEKILHRFAANGHDGFYPAYAPLVVDTEGNIYGITESGGESNQGLVFEVTP